MRQGRHISHGPCLVLIGGRLMAQSGSSLMRGFAAGVGLKADIDAAALTLRRGRRRHPREGGDLLAAP